MESSVIPSPPPAAKKIVSKAPLNRVKHPTATDVAQRSPPPTSKNLYQQMLQRLHQFVQSSLQENSTPLSIVDTSTLMLMKALVQFDEAITAALEVTPDPLERIDGLRSAIDMMLRLTKQVESFGRLRMQLEEAQRMLTQLTLESPPSEVSQ